MRRHRQSLWTSFPLSIAVSVIFGVAAAMIVSLAMAGITFLLLREMIFIRYIAVTDLFIEGLSAGWLCGRYRRRHGLKEGAVCGCVTYILLAALSLFLTGGIYSPSKLILLAVSGAVGGVWGVNTKRISP